MLRYFTLLFCVLFVHQIKAEQPIFGEMPRWDGGWGIQVLHEYNYRPDILEGKSVIHKGVSKTSNLLRIEGVYTWSKELRITTKIPVLLNSRKVKKDALGNNAEENAKGIGHITLALPLKSYFNLDGRSGSWTLAPQVRIPGSKKADDMAYYRDPGAGLYAGYETESYRYHFGTGLSGWLNTGDKPSALFGELHLGINFHTEKSSGHIKWKNKLELREDESKIYKTGATVYYRLTDEYHVQANWLVNVYEEYGAPNYGNGQKLSAGFAYVY